MTSDPEGKNGIWGHSPPKLVAGIMAGLGAVTSHGLVFPSQLGQSLGCSVAKPGQLPLLQRGRPKPWAPALSSLFTTGLFCSHFSWSRGLMLALNLAHGTHDK